MPIGTAPSYVSCLRLALVGHGGSTGRSRLGVEVLTRAERLEVLVELVDQRDARGDVQLRDVVVADALELLDESTIEDALREYDPIDELLTPCGVVKLEVAVAKVSLRLVM